MIRTKVTKSGIELLDDSGELEAPVLVAVKAALQAGLTEFTVPTPEPDDRRIDWTVRQWVLPSLTGGRPRSFLVAFQDLNAHFEVLGPEVPLEGTSSPPTAGNLQRRTK